ncbi:hypothetical protein [Nocardia tengchongensis]|uniref:hypothetical protein n=1 Tax=Nocardia tengchongensis TaxID=2055889 RepID=UPI003654B693
MTATSREQRLIEWLRHRAERAYAHAVTAERLARALHGRDPSYYPALLATRNARIAAVDAARALEISDDRLSELAEAENLSATPD